VPAGIYPLAFAQDKDLSDAAGLVDVVATGLKLVHIVRVDHSGVAIDLDFGFGKLEREDSQICSARRRVMDAPSQTGAE
jgi:hypothetical protein